MKWINKYSLLDEEARATIREVKRLKNQMVELKDLFSPAYYRRKFAEENVPELKKDNHKRKDADQTHPERSVEYALRAIGYEFNREFKLIGRYYDFYLPDINILIEVDGEFWHPESLDEAKYNSQKKNFFNDIIKDALAEAENIPLIRIRENRILELSAEELQGELERLITDKINERKEKEDGKQ